MGFRAGQVDVAVVGAGPAGLWAGLTARLAGAAVTVIDENLCPGGQLRKQIHKFFGSAQHYAGQRGITIASEIYRLAVEAGCRFGLGRRVYGVYGRGPFRLAFAGEAGTEYLDAQSLILATGAGENALAFPGWTLPGVMTAGAVQTLVNLQRVLPGRRIVMVGSGNVGLIVSYQLLLAGISVAAVVESKPDIGGYGVHAAKLAKEGVPILTGYTILEAVGEQRVESVRLRNLSAPGQTLALTVDTVCLAVGMTPLVRLVSLLGGHLVFGSGKGGFIPAGEEETVTNIPGLFVAGDASGVAEASIAMEEGRLAGIHASRYLGLLTEEEAWRQSEEIREVLIELRRPVPPVRERRLPPAAEPSRVRRLIMECPQEIPCNPCERNCPRGAIRVGRPLTNRPQVDNSLCNGCGKCIAVCPGMACYLLEPDPESGESCLSFAYEGWPLPRVGDWVMAVAGDGRKLRRVRVQKVRNPKAYAATAVVTVAAESELAPLIRGMVRGEKA